MRASKLRAAAYFPSPIYALYVKGRDVHPRDVDYSSTEYTSSPKLKPHRLKVCAHVGLAFAILLGQLIK
jgi:hypothetical protein